MPGAFTAQRNDPLLIADRVQIEALHGEFADAAMMRDFDRFAALFTADGVWRMPQVDAESIGRDRIRVAIENAATGWNYLIQHVHPGTIFLDGDTATGRCYLCEVGQLSDGGSHHNHGVYHDRYRRTAEGWRFAERSYEARYIDTAPLTGAVPATPTECRQP